MNRMLSTDEIATLEATASVVATTRREKLLRWASLVRAYTGNLRLFHGLEYQPQNELDRMNIQKWDASYGLSAFGLAAADPVLKDDGARLESVGDTMRYFELSQAELHEFSCDCGGAITNTDMASRIEKLAG